MLTAWTGRELNDVLAGQGLAQAIEQPFPNDGWSGSQLTQIEGRARSAVIKRTSWSTDWIVRATADRSLREAWIAGGGQAFPGGVTVPYLGVARDGEGAAILMADLSADLIRWSEGALPIDVATLDLVLRRVAALHRTRWWDADIEPPWCPVELRVGLLTRKAAERYLAEGVGAGERFLAGWAAFDRHATRAARRLVDSLTHDAAPLLRALAELPAAGLHGDLKLANVAVLPNRDVSLIDWQMTLRAPVAVELGWFLVSNVAQLPEPPDAVLERYRSAAAPGDDFDAQVDLTWIVGLLLRGWRKGLDAEARVPTGWGASGEDDLAEWCDRAVGAADRRL